MRTKVEAMKDLAKVRRRKIIIQKLTNGFDEIGNPTQEWIDWKTIWAERSSLWGQEYYAAAAVGQEETVTFTFKYVAFLDEMNTVDYRLFFDKKTYDIKNIDPLKDDGMWLKIRAIERPSGAGDG